MIVALRLFFAVVFASMVGVTSWASLQQSLLAIPAEVVRNPWFIATLFDAYWGFLTFYVWLAWKEQGLAARVLWFVAVVLLGNLAMSLYLLVELFRVSRRDELALVVTRRNPGRVAFPAALVAAAVGIYLLA